MRTVAKPSSWQEAEMLVDLLKSAGIASEAVDTKGNVNGPEMNDSRPGFVIRVSDADAQVAANVIWAALH